MRKITYKVTHGFKDRLVLGEKFPIKFRQNCADVEIDRSWANVRAGFEMVTVHVPPQFDLAYRYLKLYGLNKYVHDFSINNGGWGWHLTVSNRNLWLHYLNPSAVLDEPTVGLVANFHTRNERRQALKMMVNHLILWRNQKFGDPYESEILLTHAKNLLVYQGGGREWDDISKDEQKTLIQTAKIFHGHSIKYQAKL